MFFKGKDSSGNAMDNTINSAYKKIKLKKIIFEEIKLYKNFTCKENDFVLI